MESKARLPKYNLHKKNKTQKQEAQAKLVQEKLRLETRDFSNTLI